MDTSSAGGLPPVDRRWEALTAALASRYILQRELARGGMATVYLALGVEDRQPVAIKVMQPKLASALGAERFRREIEIASSMAHPLIVPVHGSGNADGLLYYVMPYVDGETLFDRLQRDRRIPLGEALQIARDVSAALGYAHERAVLHRDVKPENILLAGGRALIADFGLARAIGADYRKLTSTGIIVGTVFYMSPEQLREDRDLDQRADIYSVGCLLYEMLTGGPPYTGSSLKNLVARILQAPIPSARRVDPEVPAEVDEAIARALAKVAAERYSSMEEFSNALS
jgi:serine/threonine protein kinase